MLLFHLVFPVKYRRIDINGNISDYIKEVCLEIGERYEIQFVEIGTDEDHVHFLVHSNDTVTALINSGLGVSLLSKPLPFVEGIKFIPTTDVVFIRKNNFVWRKDNQLKALSIFLSV